LPVADIVYHAALAAGRGMKVVTGGREFHKISGEVDIEWLY